MSTRPSQDANIASENGFCRLLPLSHGVVAPYSHRQHLQSAYSSSLPLISTDSNRLGYTHKPDLCPALASTKPHVEFVTLVWKV